MHWNLNTRSIRKRRKRRNMAVRILVAIMVGVAMVEVPVTREVL
jgi:hypothetical protein